MDKFDILRRYFGYESFRNGQQELIDAILARRDCLGIMPTGSGKSLCFQIPAMLLNGTTIAVSPLISLMNDQITSLNRCGIPAICLNSTISEREIVEIYQNASNGAYKIIYVAPERLLNPRFLRLCGELTIPLVAVDEAHCVSQWGHNFRRSYLDIPRFVQIAQTRPTVAAFTATATDTVKRDIARILALQSPLEVSTGYDRPNLYFDVRRPHDRDRELLGLLENLSGSAIVYCMTKRTTEAVCEMLRRNNIRAGLYHGGLSSEERIAAQSDFVCNHMRVMIATNAFGMGIDKSDVTLVVHYNMPLDLESYYQEAGRAGRNGSDARCVLLYDPSDVEMARYLIDNSGSSSEISEKERKILRKRSTMRFEVLERYCNTKKCLRSFILNYFGEMSKRKCGFCSNCLKGYVAEDVTIETQMFLSCIFRVRENGLIANTDEICRILRGDVSDERFFALSTFGIMRETSLHHVMQLAQYLLTNGFFVVSDDDGGCALTEKADRFIKSKGTLIMRVKSSSGRRLRYNTEIPNAELYERLKAVREEFASGLGIPARAVFEDSVLIGICAALPTSIDELLKIDGVNMRKMEVYGRKFLSEVVEYLNTRPKCD